MRKLSKSSFIKNNIYKPTILLAFAIGTFSGISYIDFVKRDWYTQEVNLANTNVCFSPPSGCSELIAKEIFNAKKELYIQAYGFTSDKIVSQIVQAHKRGVKVHVLLDKSNLTDKYSKLPLLTEAGIKVKIDKLPGIAHNKVIVIDGIIVITGSFNFTNSADKRNAENILLIQDTALAARYIENWHNRYVAN